jgi:hypothetical protein
MSTDLIVKPDDNSSVPAYMREAAAPDSILRQYVKPSRLKILQDQRSADYSNFRPGSCILSPGMIPLTEDAGQPFMIVPLLFYPEFCTINPVAMKGILPMVRDRTLSQASPIARKAQSAATREEPCPENPQHKLRHVEYLNFIVLVLVEGFMGTPVLLSFSKGEHRTGQAFASQIVMRAAPMHGCLFKAEVPRTKRSNTKGSWYGLDISNPTSGSRYLSENDYATTSKLAESLREQLSQSLIQVDYDEIEEESIPDPTKF